MSRNFLLTRETKRLLNDNLDFFRPLGDLASELGLKIPPGDPEAHTELNVLLNGDIQVLFVYPIDNNKDSGDGRIYLKDSFVFDPKEEGIKNFQRAFDVREGKDHPWKEWAEKFRKASADFTPDKWDESLHAMAIQIGHSFARPISASLSKKISDHQEYFLPAILAAGEIDRTWRFRKGDPQSHFTLVRSEDKLILTLAFPLDNDADPTNGRLFFYEKFILDGKTQALEKVVRDWRVPPGLSEEKAAEWKDAAQRLNQLDPPSGEAAQIFLQAILPEILKPPTRQADLVGGTVPLVPDPLKREFPKIPPAPWRRSKQVSDPGREILVALAEETGQADLSSHPAGKKLRSILRNPDAATRGAELLRFARQDLLAGEGYPKTLAAILRRTSGMEEIKTDPKLQTEIRRLSQLLEGTGDLGTKMEFLLPQFVDGVANPSTLVAMSVAPFAGIAAEASILRALRGLGGLGRGIAGGGGLLAEAAAFSGLHRGLDLAAGISKRTLPEWRREFAATALLFGLTRFAHAGTRWLSGQLSKGRLGSWAVQGPTSYRFFASPSGRIGIHPVFGAELSPWVSRLAGLGSHAAGVAAMVGAGKIGQHLGLRPKNNQGNSGEFFDALWMYAHAMAGFNLANRLSGGGLQARLALLKWRVAGREELPDPPLTLDPVDDAVGKGLGNWLAERMARDKLSQLRRRLHQVKEEHENKSREARALEKRLDRSGKANAGLFGQNAGLKFRMAEMVIDFKELDRRHRDTQAKLTGAINDLQDAEDQLQGRETEINSLRDQVAKEIDRARRAEGRANLTEQALEEANRRIQNVEAGFKKLEGGIGEKEAMENFLEGLAAANREIELLRGGLGQKRHEVDELQEKLERAERDLAESQKTLAEVRSEMARIRSETSGVRRRAELAEAGYEVLKQRADSAEKSNESLRAELEQVGRTKADLAERKAAAEARLAEAQEKISALEKRVADLGAQVDAAGQGLTLSLEQSSRQLQKLENEVAGLKAAQEQLEKEKRFHEARADRVEKERKEVATLQETWLKEAEKRAERAERELAEGKALASAPGPQASIEVPEEIPTNPFFSVSDSSEKTSPAPPPDVIPAAGVDSPPSAHVAPAGVSPGGDLPTRPGDVLVSQEGGEEWEEVGEEAVLVPDQESPGPGGERRVSPPPLPIIAALPSVSPTPGEAGPPEIRKNQLKMGHARRIQIRNSRKEPGKFYLEEGEGLTYTLALKKVMMFEDDLVTIENAGEGRFQITNHGVHLGLRIHNSGGKEILLPRGDSEYIEEGDLLSLPELELEIQK